MTIAFLIIATLMWIAERLWPRSPQPDVPGWPVRAVTLTLIQAGVVWTLHRTLDVWLEKNRLYELDRLGEVWGTAAAFLLMTFVAYWQHRLKHYIPFLWRTLHQIHHSPERLELLTSFYRNPLEISLNMLVMSSVLFLVGGADANIAVNVVLLLGLADMFYHWNVRTPYWIGFLIQRPESHGLHHLRGVHAFNYGDIVLWDVLFGTFRNLRRFEGQCGFGEGRERNLGAMLAGRDQSEGAFFHGWRHRERATGAHE